MRWEELFAELEGHWDALSASERAGEIAERTRAELARVQLMDRLRASLGREVLLTLANGQRVSGELRRVGADFVLIGGGRVELLAVVSSVVAVSGLADQSRTAEQAGPVATRLGIGSALRRIARDRLPVSVALVAGGEVHGTPRRVGADFVEIAEHPAGAMSRADEIVRVSALPFRAIAVVRREVEPDPAV
ncbi:MAG: hypothetical protein GEU93_05790 [Propionibacteriales bacterium]|nr:hypothetical protein [Propionibacteriales bacterium]